jgi:long-subunit acyl-CoA synthetase (AMP-forming)
LTLESQIPLRPRYNSLGHFVMDQAVRLGPKAALMHKQKGRYVELSWTELVRRLLKVAAYFAEAGGEAGDRVAFCSENRPEMLVCELALTAMGLVHVPLYFGYKPQRVNQLLEFTQGQYLVVSGAEQLAKIDPALAFRRILHFDEIRDPELRRLFGPRLVSWGEVMARPVAEADRDLFRERVAAVDRDTTCLMMYTSGTMGFPKGVQLSHGNLLSQQEALEQLWGVAPGRRMLSFLPWHHSFGGIFEKYFALYSGTCMALDDSKGKDTTLLLENWREVRPNYFFSIPKVFKEVVTRIQVDPALEEVVFHPGLDFVFTAGAPLEAVVAEVFKARRVPVLEGWGLTETSPCCTLTDGGERQPGVVGRPIPGVRIRLDQDGELLIKGPNVMSGYFRNEEENARAFDEEGWYRTGDLGELVEGQVRLLTRKDRVFKLASAEKVNPTAIENTLLGHCQLVKHALVFGSGMGQVCALLFPNQEGLLGRAGRSVAGCANPGDVGALSACLDRCIATLNAALVNQYERIGTYVLIDRVLDIDRGELTPSMKIIPRNVYENFQDYVRPLLEPGAPRPADAIYIQVKHQARACN